MTTTPPTEPIEECLPKMLNELMEFDNEQDFWDYPPMLYIVSSPRDDDPGKFRVHMLPVGDVWEHGETRDMLYAIAASVGMPFAPVPPLDIAEDEEVVAVMMRNEAWKLSTDQGLTQEEIQAWGASGKRFAEHPQAQEVKAYMGYYPSTHVMVTYIRQTGELTTLLGGEGAINDGLELLFTNAAGRKWQA